jgi:hypothetical protein
VIKLALILGELTAMLTADARDYKKGLKDAEKAVKKWERSITKLKPLCKFSQEKLDRFVNSLILKELRQTLLDRWSILQNEFDDIDINDIFNDIEKKYLK